MKLPEVRVDVDYVKFGGGLDLATPVLSIPKGCALAAMNYEPDPFGGYRRIDGFERFDGRPSPSAAVYYYAPYTLTGAVAVGNTVTGVTSAATAVVAAVDTSLLVLTKMVGTFVSGETINVAAAPQGTLTAVPLQSGAITGLADATYLNAATDIYRTDILKVNGAARTIRGVWMYKGVLYSFQDNAGATACEMFKSSSSGWTAVALGREMSFTSGGTYVMAVGDTITGETSAATAVITRVVLQSGSFAGGDAAGRLIFASQTGTFQAETIKVGANLNVANIAANSTAITLAPLGRYEFIDYNFTGSTDTKRMYGCDGVNRAFEFDGSVFVPIATGMTTDTPTYISAHKNMLTLSFFGSSQNSAIGNPYQWTPLTGASEIGLGDTITGYAPQPGGTLMITSRNKTGQLSGTSTANFVLSAISDEVGAIGRTVQTIGSTLCLDDRGIIQVTRTQDYGNFNHASVSRKAQPVIDTMRTVVVASAVYRGRTQYRLYGSDGSGVIVGIEAGKVIGITQFDYPVNVTCVCSCEDSTGKDVVFFGADNGYVYQADKGSSFDGEPIEAYLRMPFNNTRSPRYRKRYRKVALEMSAVGYASIRVQPEFTYGDEDVASHATQDATVQGTGGYYDVDNYESIFYDARVVSSPEFSIAGTGLNVSLIFYSNTDIDRGHVLQGAMLHYSIRRLQR